MVEVEEWFPSKSPVFSLNIDHSSGTWLLISFRRQGLKEKGNYRFEQFVPVIVKSILDLIVGTIDFSSFVCPLYCCPHTRSAADPRMDGRSQAGLRAGALQITTRRIVLEMCSLCVCSALRKRMASLSFCIFPQGGREASGGGRGHCESVKKCFIRRSKFCTIGPRLLLCIVCLCACVVFLFFVFFWFCFVSFPGKALLFFPHSALPPCPYFYFIYLFIYFLCWDGETHVCWILEWDQTKQHKIYLCILFWLRPNQTEGTCISKYK